MDSNLAMPSTEQGPSALGLNLVLCVTALWVSHAGAARAQLDFVPSWEVPAYAEVRKQVVLSMDIDRQDDAVGLRFQELWPEGDHPEIDNTQMLDRLVESFALVDDATRQLLEQCNRTHQGPLPVEYDWLRRDSGDVFVRNNLRLYCARWLSQRGFYDEVLALLEDTQVADVVDPASLLFCRMVAYHQLVRPDECRATLVQLLEQQPRLPLRYLRVAELVRQDLSTLKDESLDHIARRMNDIRRRLDLGRAGDRVQSIEQGVVSSLTRLIDKIEKQQQQGSGQSAASPSRPSGRPMEDSRPAELKGPGRVDRRDIDSRSGWGNLPAKEREQALQQIGREFPAYYQELIEQYFRDLANEDAADRRGDN